MVDLKYLNNINISSVPHFQKVVGHLVLTPNYRIFADVKITFEGIENVPQKENVIFAMNHTDRFNYWPFQYRMWKLKAYPYTTVWVKGKYYKNAVLGKLLDWCNLIPVPSLKYLIEEIYANKMGKRLREDEYRAIKDAIEGADSPKGRELAAQIHEKFLEFIVPYYETIMERVAELSRIAIRDKKQNIIIFPEGTRSTTLSEGKTGLAQFAVNTRTTIVPVGCNNSHRIYPGNSPFAKSGEVIYRIGEPLSFDGALKKFRIDEDFKFFSAESRTKYRGTFDEVTGIVMARIGDLVDEEHRVAGKA